MREDHGLDVAIAWEDPDEDDNPDADDFLWHLARGLQTVFVSGRDDDGNGKRDLVVADRNGGDSTIEGRFTAADEDARWGIPQDKLQIKTLSYPHEDHLPRVAMEETASILSDFLETVTPTLLFAREESFKGVNLDGMADPGDNTPLQASLASAQEMTIASLNWAPFKYENGDWRAYPMEEYWDHLETRFTDGFQEYCETECTTIPPDALESVILGRMVVSRGFYAGLAQGTTGMVVWNGDTTWNDPNDPAFDEANIDVDYSDADLAEGVSDLIGVKWGLVSDVGTDIIETAADHYKELVQDSINAIANLEQGMTVRYGLRQHRQGLQGPEE